MATVVRVFYHTGVTTAPVNAAAGRYTTDSVAMLKQPYLARSALTLSGSAQSSAAAPSNAKLALVQVQEGKSVHVEVNPENRAVEADTSSPTISGEVTFECGPGWTFSFTEHTVV